MLIGLREKGAEYLEGRLLCGSPMPCWTAATRALEGQGLMLNRTSEGHKPPPRRQAAGLCSGGWPLLLNFRPTVRTVNIFPRKNGTLHSYRRVQESPSLFMGASVQKSPVHLVYHLLEITGRLRPCCPRPSCPCSKFHISFILRRLYPAVHTRATCTKILFCS